MKIFAETPANCKPLDAASTAADLLIVHGHALTDLEFCWLGRLVRDLDHHGIPISEAESALISVAAARVLQEAVP